MTDGQKEIWLRVIRDAPAGVLFRIDETILRLWVETVDRRAELQRLLDKGRGELGWEDWGAHRGIDRCTALLIRLSAELGFTPASRPRIQAEVPHERSSSDPWAILKLRGSGSDETVSGAP